MVRVLPDVAGLAKEFDYLLTPDQQSRASIGDLVRVELNGRRVGGWITAIGLEPPAGVHLRPVTRLSSAGPSAELVELAQWTAHRWSGRVASVLTSASPPRRVPPFGPIPTDDPQPAPLDDQPQVGVEVVRVPPGGDGILAVVSEAATHGDTVVVTPRVGMARHLVGQLRRAGVAARLHPREWAQSAHRGGVVVGARSAVWARVPALAAVVVIDEHDEALQEERNPTWHAREVAVERARRAGARCLLVSPCPSPEALALADHQRQPSRTEERAGWPLVEVVDRRDEPPGQGLFSTRVVDAVRQPGRVLCVLNRKGRAVMLACALCGELAVTEDGDRLMVERDGHLVCPSTGEARPVVCAACGATRLKRLRLGVGRGAEELAALVGEPVTELSAEGRPEGSTRRVVIGTEAALHHLDTVDRVVFLDFDQELLAPRYRAGPQAMALLVLAARLAGPRPTPGSGGGGGRLIVQTRVPDHRVLTAATRAAPAGLTAAEAELRQAMRMPPFAALAELSGAGAAELAARLAERPELEVLGPRPDDRYLVRASTPEVLAQALADTPRPAARHRVAVDPPRV